VIDVPESISYSVIRHEVEKLSEHEIIGYAEPCLSEKHRYE